MQPVQFQCGHCGKLMAVADEHLGRQVRCPNCQQIVVAPPPAAPAPEPGAGGPAVPPSDFAETLQNVPTPTGDVEDIFSPADISDDLFGGGEAPRIEMPPEPLAPTLARDNAGPPPPEVPLPSTVPWVPPLTLDPAAMVSASFAPLGGSASTEILPGHGQPAWMSGAVTETLASPPPEVPLTPPSETPSGIARGRGRTEAKVPWFMLLVFSPLLLYAIFITIFSVLLYRQEQEVEQQLRRRFEIMPDEGDKPGVQKEKKEKQIRLWRYDPKLPTLLLPEYLCTTLGEPLRIGDLEVTPDRVERKRMKVVVGTNRPEPCLGDSLVLYLRMKNLSSEYAFAPLDNYFDRHWSGGAQPPFTFLEVGAKHRFHGGPADWHPLSDHTHYREWVEGRHDLPDVLQPGEEKELFVCTDGNDTSAAALLFGGARPAYRGSFLWRVRLRRGLVRFQNKDYSATAVFGVRFTDQDITTALPQVQ